MIGSVSNARVACRFAGGAAEKAPGRVTHPIRQNRERRFVINELVFPAQTESAAKPPWAVGVRDKAVTRDAHRVVLLGLFDRGVLCVLHVRLHGVGPVGRMPAAVPSRHRFVKAVVLARTRVAAPETDLTDHPLRAGGHAIGNRRRECLEENFAQPGAHLPAADDGRRGPRVDRGPLGRNDVDGLVETLVERDVGVCQTFQDVDTSREGLRQVTVHRRRPLRVRAGEIESDPILLDRNSRFQMHRLTRDAVVIQASLSLERALWQLANLGPHPLLAVVDQAVHIAMKHLGAVTLEELSQAANADVAGGHLRPQVTGHFLGRPHVHEKHLQDVFDHLSAREELDDRKDEALLIDLAKNTAAGRSASAYVDVMAGVRDIADQLALEVERCDQEDIVQVTRLTMRVVHQQPVSRFQVLGTILGDGARDDAAGRHKMRRLAKGLRHHAARGVNEGAGVIEARLDVRRVGGPAQSDRHFLRRLDERVANRACPEFR